MIKNLLLILATTLASGCATYYQEPSKTEPHAIVKTHGEVTPLELNGLPRSEWKVSNWSYRVPPGKNQLFVVTNLGRIYGEGIIEFEAQANETYHFKSKNETEVIIIQLFDSEDHLVATESFEKKASRGGNSMVIPVFIPN